AHLPPIPVYTLSLHDALPISVHHPPTVLNPNHNVITRGKHRAWRDGSVSRLGGDRPQALEQGEVFVCRIVEFPAAVIAAKEPNPVPLILRRGFGRHSTEEVRGWGESHSLNLAVSDLRDCLWQIRLQERAC